jgi:nucleoid DNA-binding protein
MTKDEMVEGILRNCGISKANVERFYDGLAKLLAKELAKNSEVPLPGLGVLRVVKLKARTARNPRTGEAVEVPSKKTVRFRPYKELRDLLNPRLAAKADEAAAAAEPASEPAAEPAAEESAEPAESAPEA